MYLSSNGAALDGKADDEAMGPKSDKYESLERAGRFKARPALRNIGHVVVEKL